MGYRMILVGTGGWGRQWCEKFLPPNIKDGLVELVAAVDIEPQALINPQIYCGLRPDQCFSNIEEAFRKNRADFCAIVVPPSLHEYVVDLALMHDMHILSEKPIADTLEGSVRIVEKVNSAGVKMGVTMSHRFDRDKTTLRQILRSGRFGKLDYLVCRFTCDCRKFASWGKFRHEILDPLMIEGAVHHLDILADLAGAKCDTIYAQTWNPQFGEYAGDSQGLVTMQFENGVRSFYEGAKSNAVGLNCWSKEYFRAECERATIILNKRKIEYFEYDSKGTWAEGVPGSGTAVPLLEQPKWANTWLIEKFIHWLDGGEKMETNIEDNLQSVALIYAGIESSRTGRPVKVQEKLKLTRENAIW